MMSGEFQAKRNKGGRPPKKVRRESHLMIRLTTTERFLIESRAKKAGLTPSEWFRKSALKAKVTAKLTTDDLKLLRSLAGMANNLNQIARIANKEGLLVVQKKCRELIAAIDRKFKELKSDDVVDQ